MATADSARQWTSSPLGAASPSAPRGPRPLGLWVYVFAGILFGVVLTKAEVISWFRIQEMFRFQGFHMFGIFATALPTGIVTVQAIKRRGIRTVRDEAIVLSPKQWGRGIRYLVGGTIFGLGWALTGACPGPLFALLGTGVGVMSVAIGSALLGTWTYGWLRPQLPH